jgi:hypothetical protein
MFPSAKNTTPFGCSPNPNFEEKSSHPFGSFPKPQISDLAVLAAYPFGSILGSVSKGVYRYGMNTQEKDNEIYGEGNSYSAEYWQYDARLGRRWNVDPVVKVHESPYATFANNPVWFVDPNGADTSFTGDEYGLQAQKDFDETFSEVKNRIVSVSKDLESKKMLAEKEKWSEKKINKEITPLEEELIGLKKIETSFEKVISKTGTIFLYTAQPLKGAPGETKQVTENMVLVRTTPGRSDVIVHETRHAFGFLLKEWNATEGYDFVDEKEAYLNQMVWDAKSVYDLIEAQANNKYIDNPELKRGYTLEKFIEEKYKNEKGIIPEWRQHYVK